MTSAEPLLLLMDLFFKHPEMHTLTNRVEAAWAESGRRYNPQCAAERHAHHLQLASVHEPLAERTGRRPSGSWAPGGRASVSREM
jgi:hypothetical protein